MGNEEGQLSADPELDAKDQAPEETPDNAPKSEQAIAVTLTIGSLDSVVELPQPFKDLILKAAARITEKVAADQQAEVDAKDAAAREHESSDALRKRKAARAAA